MVRVVPRHRLARRPHPPRIGIIDQRLRVRQRPQNRLRVVVESARRRVRHRQIEQLPPRRPASARASRTARKLTLPKSQPVRSGKPCLRHSFMLTALPSPTMRPPMIERLIPAQSSSTTAWSSPAHPTPPPGRACAPSPASTKPPLHAAYWAHRHDYDRGALTGPSYWHAVATARRHRPRPHPDRRPHRRRHRPLDRTQPAHGRLGARLQRAGIRTGILSNIGDAMADGIVASSPGSPASTTAPGRTRSSWPSPSPPSTSNRRRPRDPARPTSSSSTTARTTSPPPLDARHPDHPLHHPPRLRTRDAHAASTPSYVPKQ